MHAERALAEPILLHGALVRAPCPQGRVFSTVLVVTDRLQLDSQLSDTVVAFLKGGSGRIVVCTRALFWRVGSRRMGHRCKDGLPGTKGALGIKRKHQRKRA